MRSAIIDEERAQWLINVASYITEREVRGLTIASIYGIALKFLNPIQMRQLSEVFIMIDPFDELVNKRMEEKIKQMADPFVELIDEVSGGKISELEQKIENVETRKDIETAKKLLEKKMSVDFISEVTDLEPATILELNQQA